MNEYVYNTMYNAVSSLFKLQIFEEEGLKNYDCVVVGNEHDLSYLLAGTYQIMKKYAEQMLVKIDKDDGSYDHYAANRGFSHVCRYA